MLRKFVLFAVILTATNVYATGFDKTAKPKEASKEEPYVLVAVAMRAKTLTMQEFSSKEKCEAVKDAIKIAEETAGEFDLSLVAPFRMKCFPK